MSRPAIRVEGLSKKFALSIKRAMLYGLHDIMDTALGREEVASKRIHTLRPSEFWALQDVSFEIQEGECVGVIGHNGAGKSTLFSLLSGIYGPTSGKIEVNGSLQALIALGAGFHPMLSGRENIYINASILGLRTRQINDIIEEIIDFSELGEFIDMPVKKYSSGMMMRLGFSVAVHMKPEILLIDEVLSVGDLAFRNKSFTKMLELINSGVSLLFVSHWAQAVEMICSHCIWLDHGRVKQMGATRDLIPAYTESMEMSRPRSTSDLTQAGDELFPVKITHVRVSNASGAEAEAFTYKENIVLTLRYLCEVPVTNPYFQVRLRRAGGEYKDLSLFCMHDDAFQCDIPAGRGEVTCVIKEPNLGPGTYEVRCGIMKNPTILIGQGYYQDIFTAAIINIRSTPERLERPGMLQAYMRTHPSVLIDHEWQVDQVHDKRKG